MRLSVLTEIVGKARAYKAGDAAHVVNLTLLPMSPEDMECLPLTLGVGAVTILSRGYGNCRITSTRLPNVWWVQYFNSMDTLILNTIEVSDVPEVALASTGRLRGQHRAPGRMAASDAGAGKTGRLT